MLIKSAYDGQVALAKDLVGDQTFYGIFEKFNTGGTAFDVTEGFGAADTNSSLVLVAAGGFPDQRMTATMKYVAPSASGNEDIGVIVRAKALEAPNASYYYARVDAGVAKITKVLDGVFSTLTSQAFVLPVDTLVTITFSAIGTALSATFDAGGAPATVNLNAIDADIDTGLMAFRSLSSSVYCRSFLAEEI